MQVCMTHISMINNSVTHLRSYTNTAITDIAMPSTDVAAPGIDVSALSTDIVTSNGMRFIMIHVLRVFHDCDGRKATFCLRSPPVRDPRIINLLLALFNSHFPARISITIAIFRKFLVTVHCAPHCTSPYRASPHRPHGPYCAAHYTIQCEKINGFVHKVIY